MPTEATEYIAVRDARKAPHPVSQSIRATTRMVMPVLALLAVFIWADFGSDQKILAFDAYFMGLDQAFRPSAWLTEGHLVLPLMFLVLNLTNRRYGSAYATAQVTIVWVLLGALVYYYFVYSTEPLTTRPLPSQRTCVAFVAAMLAAQFVSISVFDLTRGGPWWRAPLYSAIWGSMAYAIVFYPAAKMGMEIPWSNHMVTHFGFMAAAAFLMLIPYYMFRPMIKPLPGFGGA